MGSAPTPTLQPWLLTLGCVIALWVGRDGLNPGLLQRTWLLAACVNAVAGLLQYAGMAHGLAPWIEAAMPGEAFGNLRQRNQYATLINIGIATLVTMAAANPAALRVRRTLWLLLALLLGTANAASVSRTGLVQLMGLSLLPAIWWKTRKNILYPLLLTVWVGYGIGTLLLPGWVGVGGPDLGVLGRLAHEKVDCISRLTLWRNVLELIAQRPLTGWGWGELDYAHFVTLYEGPRFCDMVDNAHNLFLHLAVELGLPLTFVAASLLLSGLWCARPWREARPHRQQAWAVIGLLLLHSLLEYPLWFGPFQLALALSLWLLWTSETIPVTARPGRRIERLGATLALGVTIYAAWDYQRISQIYRAPEQRMAAYRDNTLEKVRDTPLFGQQVMFAEYMLTPLSPDTASATHAMGLRLLHYSPEPRVVEKLIESALLLGRVDEARFLLTRYCAAYPFEYANWATASAADLTQRH